MYFHVMLGANDLAASEKFYDATFGVLGVGAKGQFRDAPRPSCTANLKQVCSC